MAAKTENRHSRRHRHDAPLLYAFQNSDMFFSATLCNYSDSGLCFEAGYPVRPGTEIFVMLENDPRDTAGHPIRRGSHVQVRWCRPRPDADAFFYRIGARYFEKLPSLKKQ